MKTILKHGKSWNEKHKFLICPTCECEFIYETCSDIEQDYEEDMCGWDYVSKPYVRCPECGERIENFKS